MSLAASIPIRYQLLEAHIASTAAFCFSVNDVPLLKEIGVIIASPALTFINFLTSPLVVPLGKLISKVDTALSNVVGTIVLAGPSAVIVSDCKFILERIATEPVPLPDKCKFILVPEPAASIVALPPRAEL